MSNADEKVPAWRNALSLGDRTLTIAYWTAIGLFFLAFYTTPYLPLIDYHQHVAQAAIMHRLFDPNAAEHALYSVNLITYNGAFHLSTALLSYLLPPEHAGRVVMSTYVLTFGFAVLTLVRAVHRPRWYAFLALPAVYSWGMGWGFANWNLSIPLSVLGVAWYIRYRAGEKKVLYRLLILSMICSYTHVLGMLCMCTGIGIVQLSRVKELGKNWLDRIWNLALTPLVVAPGAAWCIFVYKYQTSASFSNWAESKYDGNDAPVWMKIRDLLKHTNGNSYDSADTGLLCLALIVAGLLLYFGTKEAKMSEQKTLDLRAARWLAFSFLAIYLVIPKVFVATWYISERFPPLALIYFVAALPKRPVFPFRRELQLAAATIAVAAGLNTVRMFATEGEAADASAIIDDIPPKKKLVAITYANGPERIKRAIFVHHQALYPTRKQGETGYSFTKYESMPVHYKKGVKAPGVPGGFEWRPHNYRPGAKWAQEFDVAIVHAPEGWGNPKRRVFGYYAPRVKLMSQRGRFFLYDTSKLATPIRPPFTRPLRGPRLGPR